MGDTNADKARRHSERRALKVIFPDSLPQDEQRNFEVGMLMTTDLVI
jgi:hypothetical protein